MIQNCRCGAPQDSEKGETIKSYFPKWNGMRVTVCDKCAESIGLTDKTKFEVKEYNKNVQQKTPIPQ